MAGEAPRGSGGDHERPDGAMARRERDVGVAGARFDPQRVVQDRAVRPLDPKQRLQPPGPSPARPSTTRSRTVALAPAPIRIVVVRVTSAPSATTSGASSSSRCAPSPTVTSSSSTVRARPGSATVAAIGSIESVPDSTTISTRSWSPASGPACERSSVNRPGPNTRGAIRSPRRNSRHPRPTTTRAYCGPSNAVSVGVVVVVIGDAFHRGVQVAVGAELVQACADPVGDRGDVGAQGDRCDRKVAAAL